MNKTHVLKFHIFFLKGKVLLLFELFWIEATQTRTMIQPSQLHGDTSGQLN